MNFKLNWIKLLVSVIGGILLGFVLNWIFPEGSFSSCDTAPGGKCIDGVTFTHLYVYLLISIILIYFIYSLFEKSSKKH